MASIMKAKKSAMTPMRTTVMPVYSIVGPRDVATVMYRPASRPATTATMMTPMDAEPIALSPRAATASFNRVNSATTATRITAMTV